MSEPSNLPSYSSVLIELLDRRTGETKPMLCYPVTRIVFYEFNGHASLPTRTFIAEGPDLTHVKWVERQ